jgi:hypothetical protein
MATRTPKTYKPGGLDEKGRLIPHYIVHGGPELSDAKGYPSSLCQYFDQPMKSAAHHKNTLKMWECWEGHGAQHVYSDD